MDLNANSPSTETPIRVAQDFSNRITAERTSALDGLRDELNSMDVWQIRQCAEHLCELLAEEESSAEVLSAVFGVLESLEKNA